MINDTRSKQTAARLKAAAIRAIAIAYKQQKEAK
jgi:hypothetical protein